MADRDHIRSAFERSAKAVSLRPSVGQGTAVTKVRIRDGVLCDIEDGPWKLEADLGKGEGGEASAPDPGVFGRAALGACLAQAYVLWSVMLDVPLDEVEVQVHSDYDARGMFGVEGPAPGWTGLRYTVSVASKAPEADVLRVLDAAEAHSPVLDDFSKSFDVGREVNIRTTGA